MNRGFPSVCVNHRITVSRPGSPTVQEPSGVLRHVRLGHRSKGKAGGLRSVDEPLEGGLDPGRGAAEREARADDHHPAPRHRRRELLEELERRVVGERQVVERDEERTVGGELEEEIGELGEQGGPVRLDPLDGVLQAREEPVGLRRLAGPLRGGRGGGDLRGLCGLERGEEHRQDRAARHVVVVERNRAALAGRPDDVAQEGERLGELRRQRPPMDDGVAEPPREPLRVPKEDRFPDPAVADKDDEAAVAVAGVLDPADERLDGLGPAEDRRGGLGGRGLGGRHDRRLGGPGVISALGGRRARGPVRRIELAAEFLERLREVRLERR